MRTPLVALVAVLAAVFAPAGAIPPAAGGALASDNVDFVLRIPEPGAFGGRILGDTMYVTTTQGVRIYDVSDPDRPLILGSLPLPHFGNEDVDTNGEILLVSTDHASTGLFTLYVIDVRDPRFPTLLARFQPPGTRPHTASCIDGCRYVWLAGSAHIGVVDLTNPARPTFAGRFFVDGTSSPANGTFGSSHDVNVDEAGIAWVSALAGLFAYDPSVDPVRPRLVAARPNDTPTSFVNRFIIHNSMRPNALAAERERLADDVIDDGEVVLVTEENWISAANSRCAEDGSFQTGWVHVRDGVLTVDRLDAVNLGRFGPVPSQKPQPVATCSSHYFDHRDGVAAVTWYEQGVRFFDVSQPRDIRQIGYFMGVDATAVAALYHRDVVYVFDLVRGIDVIRFGGSAGSASVASPPLRPAGPAAVTPDPTFGWGCRLVVG